MGNALGPRTAPTRRSTAPRRRARERKEKPQRHLGDAGAGDKTGYSALTHFPLHALCLLTISSLVDEAVNGHEARQNTAHPNAWSDVAKARWHLCMENALPPI